MVRASIINIQPHFLWDCGGTFRYQFPLHESEITDAGCVLCGSWNTENLTFARPFGNQSKLQHRRAWINRSTAIAIHAETCYLQVQTFLYAHSHHEWRAEGARTEKERTSAQYFHWVLNTANGAFGWRTPLTDTCSILSQIGKVWFPLPEHDPFYYYLLDSCPRTSVPKNNERIK